MRGIKSQYGLLVGSPNNCEYSKQLGVLRVIGNIVALISLNKTSSENVPSFISSYLFNPLFKLLVLLLQLPDGVLPRGSVAMLTIAQG